MKALIRNEGETITEEMSIPFIDWKTGYPLTGEKWYGGPYKMVQNYIPPQKDTTGSHENITVEPEQDEVECENDYVVIDGKRYNKEELRSLLE